MPREDGYEARVMPSAGAQRPLPTAETFGAGIGGAIAQVGDQMHNREIRAYQLERSQRADQELSDFSHRYALHQQNMDGVVQQLRTNPTRADYGEHVKQAMDADDAAREGLLSGITEESVLRRAQQQIDGYRTRLSGQEGEFAQAQRFAKTQTDAESYLNIQANRLARTENVQDWSAAVAGWEDYVGSLNLLTPNQKAQMAARGLRPLTASFVNGMNNRNPASTLKLLDEGKFDSFLDPEQVQQLRSGAQVEIRRLDAAAEHAANVQWAQTREQIATVEEKNRQGIDVSAELPGLIQAATVRGDTSTVTKLQGIGRDSTFAKVYGQLPPVARDQELGRLRAIPEAQRSESDQAAIKWLTDKKGSLDEAFNADPVAFAAQNSPAGQGPPAIAQWSTQELAQREKWMRGAQTAYGSMLPLSKAEAGALQERALAGDKGYREVLGTLRGFSGRVAMQAVRQVLPSDDFAQSVVALAPDVQRQALDGREVLKANSTILKPRDDDEAGQISGLKTGFALALGGVPAAQRNGIWKVAESISARALEQNGMLSENMSSAMMARALDAALGSTGSGAEKRGGIGWWGGKMYLLPDRMRQWDFENAVSKHLAKGAGRLPVNPDGSVANLRNARPEAIGGNKYQFVIGGRVVSDKDGKPFQIMVNP